MKLFDRSPFDFDGNGKTDAFEFAMGMQIMKKIMEPDEEDDEEEAFAFDEDEENDEDDP